MSEKRQILDEANDAYTRLRSDDEAWADELTERAVWDCTLPDGIDDEDDGEQPA